jgi:hypothetical protein
MKAKEYAKRFKDNPTDEVLKNIFFDFVGEITTMANQRNITTNAGLKGVVIELDKKWVAFAKEVGGGIIKPDGFTDLVKLKFGDIYSQLMRTK